MWNQQIKRQLRCLANEIIKKHIKLMDSYFFKLLSDNFRSNAVMSAEAEAIVTTAAADAAPVKTAVEPVAADTTPDAENNKEVPAEKATEKNKEEDRAEKILKAKELFSQGSRNFLVKSYDEAADDLSQVCQLYEEVYGELADELGQPFLL